MCIAERARRPLKSQPGKFLDTHHNRKDRMNNREMYLPKSEKNVKLGFFAKDKRFRLKMKPDEDEYKGKICEGDPVSQLTWGKEGGLSMS